MKEIGTKTPKIGLKFRIIFAILSGLLFAGITLLMDWAMGDIESAGKYIFYASFFGLFYGVGFPFVMIWMAKKMNKKVTVNPELQDGEEINFYGPANYAKTWMAIGGKLFITDRNLIFKSHKYNLQKPQVTIPLDAIQQIKLQSTLNILDNAMVVDSIEGSYKFTVNERAVWLERLQATRPELELA